MKRFFLGLSLLLSLGALAQVQPYYNGVNFTLTGQALKNELATRITNTHTTLLQYSDVWAVLQQTDLDPTNSTVVLLLYGYNDGDGNPITDRTRNKNTNGGNVGDWNREHTYAQSLATPNMTTSSPNAGTDAHHLRSTDVQMNGNRGNRKFATSSGNAGNIGANWYPGNEWKGDVARMMMYMYLRYPSQCKPINVGVGTSVVGDLDMIDLFLNWNAQDPVSQYEKNRNNILETEQGNRNPFIDNPILATIIWGGMTAEDIWGPISVNENDFFSDFLISPVPTNDGKITLHFSKTEKITSLQLFNTNGQLVEGFTNLSINNGVFIIDNISKGIFILQAKTESAVVTRKIVSN
jgi:endonuclease I